RLFAAEPAFEKEKKEKEKITLINITMAHTGENEQALRKIVDFTRMGSIILLCIHFYYYCHALLESRKLTLALVDRLILQFRETWIFTSIYHSKWLILLL